jgi:hypothetical protein
MDAPDGFSFDPDRDIIACAHIAKSLMLSDSATVKWVKGEFDDIVAEMVKERDDTGRAALRRRAWTVIVKRLPHPGGRSHGSKLPVKVCNALLELKVWPWKEMVEWCTAWATGRHAPAKQRKPRQRVTVSLDSRNDEVMPKPKHRKFVCIDSDDDDDVIVIDNHQERKDCTESAVPSKRMYGMCPITCDDIKEPVVSMCCGHTFEANALAIWVTMKDDAECPVCRKEGVQFVKLRMSGVE